MVPLGGPTAAHVSLLEDFVGSACKSEVLLVEVIATDVVLDIRVNAALISYFLRKV